MNQSLKRAFGYVRVSSAGQAEESRDGIPRQKAAIRKWAAANGVRVVGWFEDSVSGKKDLDNRPAQTQERNDFLFSQIITEGLSLAVHCFREARTQTDLRLDVQAPNGS